jgi:hypothetical protein
LLVKITPLELAGTQSVYIYDVDEVERVIQTQGRLSMLHVTEKIQKGGVDTFRAIPTVILYYRVPNKEHFIKIVKGGQIRKG